MAKKEKKLKLALVLTLLGAVGIIAIIPYQLTTIMNNDLYQAVQAGPPIPLVIAINSTIQIFILFFLVWIGVLLQRRTGLSVPIIDAWVYRKEVPVLSKKWLGIAILVTLAGTILTLLLEIFWFQPLIQVPGGQATETIWWQGLLAMFYGGITEELMLRLFGMTLIVWLLARITKKEKDEIPNSYYIFAIFLTAILFGLGHLPATVQVFGGLTTILVIRALILNGILGLWFGYLYWKKGLEYAIVAHMSADFFLHVLFVQILS